MRNILFNVKFEKMHFIVPWGLSFKLGVFLVSAVTWVLDHLIFHILLQSMLMFTLVNTIYLMRVFELLDIKI